MIKQCKHCKKEFILSHNAQKYCSIFCLKKARKEYDILYRQENKENFNNATRKYYKKHKEKRKIYNKKYKKLHKKEIQKYQKVYYQEHKEDYNIYIKQYRQEHKKERREYETNKLKTNINYKIARYLRNRINTALKENKKSNHTIKLIGCSIDYLKQHLKNQFIEGMSWKNYGQWHIDHIRPCSSFDLSKESKQRKCFHYSNLQPLWAEDNIKKGKTITI